MLVLDQSSDRTELSVLKAVRVPLLSCLHITTAQKIADLENCRTRVEQSGTRIPSQFIGRLCPVVDPLRGPFGVPAINSVVSFRPIRARDEIAVSA